MELPPAQRTAMPVSVRRPLAESVRGRWVVVGVLLGAVLLAALVGVVRAGVPNPGVAWLVAALSLVLAGAIVGYESSARPGTTAGEMALAGALVGPPAWLVMATGDGAAPSWEVAVMALLLAPAVAALGGWAGAVLATDPASTDDPDRAVAARIGAGAVAGLVLCNVVPCLGYALAGLDPPGMLVAFVLVFPVLGLWVGWGSTAAPAFEAASAGAGTVVLEGLIVYVGFGVFFPFLAVVIAAVGAAALSLAGGWMAARLA